jgi:hypothetical protein
LGQRSPDKPGSCPSRGRGIPCSFSAVKSR